MALTLVLLLLEVMYSQPIRLELVRSSNGCILWATVYVSQSQQMESELTESESTATVIQQCTLMYNGTKHSLFF